LELDEAPEEPPKKSVNDRAGQIWASAQLGFDPENPWRASTRCWKPSAQEITAGLVGSGALIVTLTSPEIPVSFSSSLRSLSAARCGGARSRMSVSTPVPALAIQPQTASSVPAKRTRLGLAIARAIAATEVDRSRAPSHPPPSPRVEGTGVDPRQAERPSAASPPVSATRKASAIPTTRRSPNERTSGLGESAKTAKPAIVATQAAPITGPPPAAATATARPGGAPSARASLKRAWNWIA
jgi:hypothetical protein